MQPTTTRASRRATTALAAGALTAALFAACSFQALQGSGPVVTETRTVPAFTRIDANFGIGVEVRVVPAEPIQVEAQEDLLPFIETRVEGSTLRISSMREIGFDAAPRVILSGPDIEGITLNGGSEGELEGLSNRSFEADLGGGAVLTATGSSENVEIRGSGGARALLRGLSAQDVTVELSGGSFAEVAASEVVGGGVSGGARVVVTGDARLDVATTGGGEASRE
jgi:hypothetical protein